MKERDEKSDEVQIGRLEAVSKREVFQQMLRDAEKFKSV